MADIIQLKEDGVAKYIKTHADAIDGIDGKLVRAVGNETVFGTKNFEDGAQVKGKNVVVGDTGWTNLDAISGSGAMSKDFRIRREGNVVTLVANWTSDSTTGQKSILTIPTGYRLPLSRLPVAATNMSNGNVAYAIVDSSTLKVSVDVGNNSFSVLATWMTNDSWPV